jgi:uncharacterized protein (UPF0335 family)
MDEDFNQPITDQEREKQDKIYWHDAHFAAIQLELIEYENALTFEDEHQLSKEALEIDVLVIKKTADVEINKNIGRIFKGHNLFEFKSPTDYLSIWNYNKVTGYAMLYSAFEKVPISDITINFVITPKPTKLFEHLQNDRGFTISEISPGIHYVTGDVFPVQIIESKRLTSAENVFLKNLRSNLTHDDIREVFDACRKYGFMEKANSYLNRVLSANKSTLEEVLAMFDADVEEIFSRHFKKHEDVLIPAYIKTHGIEAKIEARIEARIEERKARDTAVELVKRGFDLKEVADIVKMPFEWVKAQTIQQ